VAAVATETTGTTELTPQIVTTAVIRGRENAVHRLGGEFSGGGDCGSSELLASELKRSLQFVRGEIIFAASSWSDKAGRRI